MKKFIITLLVAALPVVTFAQKTAFDKFDNVKGIEAVTISGDMFKMLGGIQAPQGGDQAQKYLDQVKSLESLKIYTTSEKKYRKELKNAITDYLKQNPLEQLLSLNEKGSVIKVYAKQGADASQLKEVLVFVEDEDAKDGKEAVLISFTGDINLNEIIKDLKGTKGSK